MNALTGREVRLQSRPRGMPRASDFVIAPSTLAPLEPGEVLVRNHFLSVDPYMRGRMNEGPSYSPAFELGKPMEGGAVGEVMESRSPEFKPGDVVLSRFGWRDRFTAKPEDLHRVSHDVAPLSLFLGALGMTGLTAWVGLRLSEAKAGETVYVSGAAGAVGHIAGQLAKLRGCRVIGSAGSSEKVSFLRDTCGFDVAFDYSVQPVVEQLREAAPDGIDVYFDNVGGATLAAALTSLRIHGRIVACGSISGYNDEKPAPGPTNLFNVITKRLTMRGLIVGDWLGLENEFRAEVGGLLRSGALKSKETVVDGLDRSVDAFLGLFSGNNVGKMIVKLS